MPESLPILLLKLCNILWFRSDLISLFYRHLKGALYIIDTKSLQIVFWKVRKVNIDFPWSLSCLTQNSAKNLELSRSSNFSVQITLIQFWTSREVQLLRFHKKPKKVNFCQTTPHKSLVTLNRSRKTPNGRCHLKFILLSFLYLTRWKQIVKRG